VIRFDGNGIVLRQRENFESVDGHGKLKRTVTRRERINEQLNLWHPLQTNVNRETFHHPHHHHRHHRHQSFQPSIITLMFHGLIQAHIQQLLARKHNWLTILLWLPSNEMFNRATDYIVLSAYIKRLKSDSSLLQLKQRFVSSLLVKYNIPSLGCPKYVIKSRIWFSFLTRVKKL